MTMSPRTRTNLVLVIIGFAVLIGTLGGLLIRIHHDHARGKHASMSGIAVVLGVTVLALAVTVVLTRRRTLNLFSSPEVSEWHEVRGRLSRQEKRAVMRAVRRGEAAPA